MEIWQYDYLSRLHFDVVLDNVNKFVERYGVDWTVRHNPLILLQFKDPIIKVEDFFRLEIVTIWPFDQVIPNLDDVVAEVQVAVDDIV